MKRRHYIYIGLIIGLLILGILWVIISQNFLMCNIEDKNITKAVIAPRVYSDVADGRKWTSIIVRMDSEKEVHNLLASLRWSHDFINESAYYFKDYKFAGNVTKKGFCRIIKNPHTVMISSNNPVSYA